MKKTHGTYQEMKRRKNVIPFTAMTVMAMLLFAGCQSAPKQGADEPVKADGISSASKVYYEESSFDQERLWQAITEAEGSCTIATVNEDGTPDLIIAVPAVAGSSHLFFNWADNETKTNVHRTGQAMISYFVYTPEAADKSERNKGARIKVSLEQDKEILEQLNKENPACTSQSTVFQIEEILPLG